MAVELELIEKEGYTINPDAKVVNTIINSICKNDGVCITQHDKEPIDYHRQCPCSSYVRDGKCYCKLYIKK